MSFSFRGGSPSRSGKEKPAALVSNILALQERLAKLKSTGSSRSVRGFEGAATAEPAAQISSRDVAAAKKSEGVIRDLESELAQKNQELQILIESNPKLKLIHDHLLLAHGMPEKDRKFMDEVFHLMWEDVQNYYLNTLSKDPGADISAHEFLKDALQKISEAKKIDSKDELKRILKDEYCRLILAPNGDESPEVVSQLLAGLEQMASEMLIKGQVAELRDPVKAHAYALEHDLLKPDSFSDKLVKDLGTVQKYCKQKAYDKTGIYKYAEEIAGVYRELLTAAYVMDMDTDETRKVKNKSKVEAIKKKLWKKILEGDPLIAASKTAGVDVPNSEVLMDLFMKNPESALRSASELFEYKEKFKEMNGSYPDVKQIAEFALYKAFEDMLRDPEQDLYKQRYAALKDVALAVGVAPETVASLDKLNDNKYNSFLLQLEDFKMAKVISDLETALSPANKTEHLLFLKESMAHKFSDSLNNAIRQYKQLHIDYMLDPKMDPSMLTEKENDILDLFAKAIKALESKNPAVAQEYVRVHRLLRDKANEATEAREKARTALHTRPS